MKKSGFDRLVITGRAGSPVYIYLSDGSAEIRDAHAYWGLNVPDNPERPGAHDLGKGVRSAVIGPAGENLVRFATVMNARKNAAGPLRDGGSDGFQKPEGGCRSGGCESGNCRPSCLWPLSGKTLRNIFTPQKLSRSTGKLGTALLYEPANKTWGAADQEFPVEPMVSKN